MSTAQIDLFSADSKAKPLVQVTGSSERPNDPIEDTAIHGNQSRLIDIPKQLGKSPDPAEVIKLMETLAPGEPFINRWGNMDLYLGESIKGVRLYMDVRQKQYSMINEAYKRYHSVQGEKVKS